MLIILFRVLLIYIIVLTYLRLMGKKQVGQMQPYELVITLIMADIATLPMTQTSMPLLFSLIPLTMVVVVHFVVSIIERKSLFMRKIINGKPMVIVSPTGINLDALKELNMTFDDLMQGLRQAGAYKLEDVAYAIVETNGTLSVILKSQNSPVVNKDLKIKQPPTSLPLIIVSCGKLLHKNMDMAKIDEKFLDNVCKKCGAKSYKELVILTLDCSGNVYVQKQNGPAQTFSLKTRGAKW